MEDPTTADGFERALALGSGPALVEGTAGSGRTELLARKVAALAAAGVGVERIMVLTQTAANRARLRDRVAELLSGSFEEVWIETWAGLGERLLRDYALEAGIDPFFEVAAPADRLALLLDRLDELPLRRHEIRGNPAGLLAGLLERIDALKAEGIGPADVRDRARAAERGATGSSEREVALRELEFSELFDRHDPIMLELGMLDEHELVLELGRVLTRHPGLSAALGDRFEWLLVDELEDAGPPQVACLPLLAPHDNVIAACDPDQGLRVDPRLRRGRRARVPAPVPGCRADRARPEPALDRCRWRRRPRPRRHSFPIPTAPSSPLPAARVPTATGTAVRFWRCANERAEAQAVAREIEHLLASGESAPGDICILTGASARESRLVAAALEERNVPFRSSTGSAAFFGRPEVRDAIAWLRALADPNDSAAVVRALTRPPVELRSVDLARCTTIARRRKLDMISAVEASLESPQLPPPSRDRLRAFLKLYRAAAGAFDGLRADVFVRRLIERIGFRRHGLFAASPETAERLVNLSRLAELAAGWTRRRPDGSTRDFVRYLAAVGEAGQRFSRPAEPPPQGAVLLAEPEQVKGMDFDRVYLLGLEPRGAALGRRADRLDPGRAARRDRGRRPRTSPTRSGRAAPIWP